MNLAISRPGGDGADVVEIRESARFAGLLQGLKALRATDVRGQAVWLPYAVATAAESSQAAVVRALCNTGLSLGAVDNGRQGLGAPIYVAPGHGGE